MSIPSATDPLFLAFLADGIVKLDLVQALLTAVPAQVAQIATNEQVQKLAAKEGSSLLGNAIVPSLISLTAVATAYFKNSSPTQSNSHLKRDFEALKKENKTQVEALKQENKDLKETLFKFIEEQRVRNETSEQMEKKVQILLEENANLKTENAAYKRENVAYKRENIALMTENSKQSIRIKELEAENKKLQSRTNDAEALADDYKDNALQVHIRLTKVIDEKNKELASLQKQLQDSNRIIEEKRQEVALLKGEER